MQERDPDQYDLFWKNPGQFRIEGGETFHEVRERALGRLLTIVRDHPGQSVLIVTHTVVVKLLMAYAENRPLHLLWELPYIHPACLCKLHFRTGKPAFYCMATLLITRKPARRKPGNRMCASIREEVSTVHQNVQQ